MLPEGWKEGMVQDLVTGLESGVSVNGSDRKMLCGENAVLKISAVSYGAFDKNAHKVIEAEEQGRAKTNPKAGQIIISRSNTEELVGASAYIEDDCPNLFLPDKLWQTIPKDNSNMKWLSYVLASAKSRYTLSRLATGTSGSMKNITKGELLSLKILIPELPEQKKIAQILSTWDQAIEITEKLIENSIAQKKALMQQLLTGKKRLPGFSGEWKATLISKFIIEDRTPGSTGDTAKKLTVKLYGKGVIPKKETRKGSESTQYFRRKGGQFIYSKLDFLNGAFGIIPAELDGYESTLDLPAFDFTSDANPNWFLFFVSRENFYSANLGLANGGRKARRVNPKDMLRVSIDAPDYAEQTAIASVLSTASMQVENYKHQLLNLQKQKKGLMQQLLTGKRRVKVDA